MANIKLHPININIIFIFFLVYSPWTIDDSKINYGLSSINHGHCFIFLANKYVLILVKPITVTELIGMSIAAITGDNVPLIA